MHGYEMEGAYEVFGTGRCRVVLEYCRIAMLMGIVVLVTNERSNIVQGMDKIHDQWSRNARVTSSFMLEIERAGRYHFLLQKNDLEQDLATTILTTTI
jgi:hypothetical protein